MKGSSRKKLTKEEIRTRLLRRRDDAQKAFHAAQDQRILRTDKQQLDAEIGGEKTPEYWEGKVQAFQDAMELLEKL